MAERRDVLGAHLEIEGSRRLVMPLWHLPPFYAQLHKPLLPARQSFHLGHRYLLVVAGELTFAASTGSMTPLYCSGPKFFSSVFGGWIGRNSSLLVSCCSSHHYCVPPASEKGMGSKKREVGRGHTLRLGRHLLLSQSILLGGVYESP
jgi:hypothetical protein